MIRQLFIEIGLFLAPFAAYALYLWAARHGVMTTQSWPMRTVIVLTAAAFVMLFASLALVVHFSGAPPNSTYVPAHMENGRLVPGVEK